VAVIGQLVMGFTGGVASGQPTVTPTPTLVPVVVPTVILTADPHSPQPVGTRVALTMSASGAPFGGWSHWYWTLSDNGSSIGGQPPNPYALPPPLFTGEWTPTVAGEHHLVATLNYLCPTLPVCPPATAELIYTVTESTPSPSPTPSPTPTPTPTGQATTSTLRVFPSSAFEGIPAVLLANVAPRRAAGTVQFMNGSSPVGDPVQVAAGVALLITPLPQGAHSLTAVFTPTDAATYASSTSQPVSLTVKPLFRLR
jgi:Bacterial Ig-like domain (group 3)